jgi:hypothetical protein
MEKRERGVGEEGRERATGNGKEEESSTRGGGWCKQGGGNQWERVCANRR